MSFVSRNQFSMFYTASNHSHKRLHLFILQVLSDNTLVNLVPGGADKFVDYEDRIEYIKLVRNCRMSEGKMQVSKKTSEQNYKIIIIRDQIIRFLVHCLRLNLSIRPSQRKGAILRLFQA